MTEEDKQFEIPTLRDPLKYHAFITHCEADLTFAKHLLEQIEAYNFKCKFAKRDFEVGTPVVDNIAEAIHSSRRTILIISKNSLRSSWCKYEMLAAIDDTNRYNRISFVPVLREDVSEEDLPHPLRFVTYIHIGQESNYLQKLLSALAAPDEDWETHIPAGNVAHGLAWSYYFGYLRLILPGMGQRIRCCKYWQDDPMKRRMCRKILLLFPESCHCPGRLDEDPSNRIQLAGNVEVTKDRAGVVGRVYKNTIYTILSNEGEPYYFVGEFVTSITTMYEMELSGIAGLKRDDTRLQSTKFLIIIRDILDRDKECRDQYKIIFYDDTQTDGNTFHLPDLIVKHIQEEISRELEEAVENLRSLNKKTSVNIRQLPKIKKTHSLSHVFDGDECSSSVVNDDTNISNISPNSSSVNTSQRHIHDRLGEGKHSSDKSELVKKNTKLEKDVQVSRKATANPTYGSASNSSSGATCNFTNGTASNSTSGATSNSTCDVTSYVNSEKTSVTPRLKINRNEYDDEEDNDDALYHRFLRQPSCPSGTSIDVDEHGRTRTIQIGNDLINFL